LAHAKTPPSQEAVAAALSQHGKATAQQVQSLLKAGKLDEALALAWSL
jgi:hypothetical protein